MYIACLWRTRWRHGPFSRLMRSSPTPWYFTGIFRFFFFYRLRSGLCPAESKVQFFSRVRCFIRAQSPFFSQGSGPVLGPLFRVCLLITLLLGMADKITQKPRWKHMVQESQRRNFFRWIFRLGKIREDSLCSISFHFKDYYTSNNRLIKYFLFRRENSIIWLADYKKYSSFKKNICILLSSEEFRASLNGPERARNVPNSK